MESRQKTSLDKLLTRALHGFWRRLLLLASFFVIIAGAAFYSHEREQRLVRLAESTAKELLDHRTSVRGWGERLADDPTLANGLALIERYRLAAGDPDFFAPLAQELSVTLAAAARNLPAGGQALIAHDLFAVRITAAETLWRHEPSKTVYRFRPGLPFQRLSFAESAADDGTSFAGSREEQWSRGKETLLYRWRHELTAAAAVLYVQAPLSSHRLADLVEKSQWKMEMAAVASPTNVIEWHAPLVGWQREPLALVIGEAPDELLAYPLRDTSSLLPVMEAGFLIWLALIIALAIGTRQWLRQTIGRLAIEPMQRLAIAVQRLPQEGAAAIPLVAEDWPEEIEAIAKMLSQSWQTIEQQNSTRQMLATALENSAHGVVITDANSRIVYLNPAACRLFGYSPEEAIGATPRLWRGDTPAEVYRLLWETLERGEAFTVVFRNRRRTGREIEVEETIAPVFRQMRGGQKELVGYAATIREITSRERLIQALERARFTDPLTGLANRVGFLWQIRSWFGSERSVAVLVVDLDDFSRINQLFGTESGDNLLKEVAQGLKEQVQALQESALAVAAHLGADQFALAVRGALIPTDYERIAQQILARFQRLAIAQGTAMPITAAVGIALSPLDGKTPEDTLQAAEYALQAAKSSGPGEIRFYDAELGRKAREESQLIERLRHAIALQEFVLFLQPKVDAEHAVVGAEALLRWTPPGEPPISPLVFVPLAEKSGLIHEIGWWVIEQALAMSERLKREGWSMPRIAVNVSAAQFDHEDFLWRVEELVGRWRVAHPDQKDFPLLFELTESMAMADFEIMRDRLQRLANLGIAISLDDFGTGHSSLARLRALPIVEIKIDRSFVMRLFESPQDEQLCASIVAMARIFDLEVVAEGVEEEGYLRRLAELGCHFFQGYGIAKPMAETDFVAWLRQQATNLVSS